MCGIAGVFDGNRLLVDTDEEQVDIMLADQAHRGPDAAGRHIVPHIALGHRRLAILDLSEAGRQPMTNENGSIHIVFNGEIYNYLELRSSLVTKHSFRSRTDTEVLIHGYEEWGIQGLLNRLCGMFAFAIADCSRPSEPVLFLARDRLGIKPLYVYSTGCRHLFASEMGALLKAGGTSWSLDPQGLAGFLAQGSVPAPLTYVSGIKSVAPSHYWTITRSTASQKRYWELSHSPLLHPKEQLASLLPEVINQHLLSDAPIGLFLSGGVDSAALAAITSRVHPTRLTSLTLGFEDDAFNESPAAQVSATRFNTIHSETTITCQTFLDHIPRFLASCDQPTSDGVNTYFVSLAAKQLGLKAVLSGLGGDEIFLGYSHYRRLAAGATLWSALAHAPQSICGLIGKLPALGGSLMGKENWQRFDFFGHLPIEEARYLLFRGFFPPHLISLLMGKSSSEVYNDLSGLRGLLSDRQRLESDPLGSFHHLEITRYLHDQLLRDSDVFSMAHSIELRVPLLDHRLVELAAAIPFTQHLNQEMNKPLLVRAVNDPLVTEFSRAPKRGFTFPFEKWLRNCADALEPLATTGRAVDPAASRLIWKYFRTGRLHWSRAWGLLVMEHLASRLARPHLS